MATTWWTLADQAMAVGIEPQEARWIVEHASGGGWEAVKQEVAPARPAARFQACVERRLTGEPLQYVLGSWAFRRLDLLVDRRVLIPRPETEWVVEQALTLLPSHAGGSVVVDLGTGSGAIGLSIAAERWPDAAVYLTDASVDALAVARANLAGLGRRGTNVNVLEGSWWNALPINLHGAIDLVVSNPPYVAPTDPLPPEVADWEPASALIPGPTGLEALEIILGGAAAWLKPGGWIVCELGETQGAAASQRASDGGLVDVEVRPDLTGRDRMVLARSRP